MFVLQLAAYFQNHTVTRFMGLFWFILHYRGLANTGFHFLHFYGIAPSVRSLPGLWKTVVDNAYRTTITSCIYWGDNLRRLLAGFLPSQGRQDWTVIGTTKLPVMLPQYDDNFPAAGPIFAEQNLVECEQLFRDAEQLNLTDGALSYMRLNAFSVPLRSPDSRKYTFVEQTILPVACGTLSGTAQLLNEISHRALRDGKFGICVLDYDLYWRTLKFFYTTSLQGAFSYFRRRILLVMGPWHIYKTLLETIWTTYAPIVFAPMWIAVKGARCPAVPDVPDILTIMVAIALTVKQYPTWQTRGNQTVSSLCLLLYHWIPLVSCKVFYLSIV